MLKEQERGAVTVLLLGGKGGEGRCYISEKSNYMENVGSSSGGDSGGGNTVMVHEQRSSGWQWMAVIDLQKDSGEGLFCCVDTNDFSTQGLL